MTPRIHDDATVEAIICDRFRRTPDQDSLIKALLSAYPTADSTEVFRRILREHIAGLEQRIKELTEWRSMETAPLPEAKKEGQ